jgi:tRNA U55 pseudouridine synthase TruB
MSVKQDRQGVRTAKDLEQKYQFGKQFAELMGIAMDARESVDSLASTLRNEMLEQVTSITRDTERIVLAALEDYTLTTDTEKLEQTISSELSIMADRITASFESATQQITEVDGEVRAVSEELQKHFEFSADGLTIKAGENAMNLVLDNDMIRFVKNGQEFGWWDGVDFHTGNIVVEVNERAQFGDFAFIPRTNGSLDFLKVGG